MKAVVLTEQKHMEIREMPKPVPGKKEVLVRVRQVGICGSDYSKYLGYLGGIMPVIPGHEAIGEIAALGPEAEGVRIGERVAIQPNFACGTCEICKSGMENVCPNKVRLGLDVNGAFAEYVVVPRKYVWSLPEGLSDSDAALTEPLAVAVHGIAKCPPTPKDKVLIYGAGAIGMFFIQLAVLSGARVTVIDIAEPRLAVARKLGAETFSSAESLEAASGGFTVVFETSGTPGAMANIVKWCAPGATIVHLGLPKADITFPTFFITRKELVIKGSSIYLDEFRTAIDLLKNGKIRTDLFITNVYPLEELPRVITDFPSPNRVKDLIRIS
ncbi:MAG: alcohol dehydrogenase catalytic domain-containing protein [Deltaproteobacteria bacterium]|nr:alcohol dehydrogenase catalytic domain-containing protein [Deltaproteobacteria bacterium]